MRGLGTKERRTKGLGKKERRMKEQREKVQ